MKLNVNAAQFMETVRRFERELEILNIEIMHAPIGDMRDMWMHQVSFRAGEKAIELARQVVAGIDPESKHVPDLQKLEHLRTLIDMHIEAKKAGIPINELKIDELLREYESEVGIV